MERFEKVAALAAALGLTVGAASAQDVQLPTVEGYPTQPLTIVGPYVATFVYTALICIILIGFLTMMGVSLPTGALSGPILTLLN